MSCEYRIKTLNASKIIEEGKISKAEGAPSFCLDFRNRFIETVIDSTEERKDTPFFYQLLLSKCAGTGVELHRTDKDYLLDALFYVNFKAIQWKMYEADAKALIENGFSVIYSDTVTKTYVAFDKSNSMAKKSRISFVDQELFPEIDRRIRLDIDFSSLKVIPSKYFAYRGLYFSDGTRIEENDRFLLNERSVLVIEDDSHEYHQEGRLVSVPVITAEKDAVMHHEPLRAIQKDQKIRLNGFDGEGLISPGYAEQLNLFLGINSKSKSKSTAAVSFQIRMPYTKGMLHQVDFQRFIKDQVGEKDYYIKDLFGVERRVKDVQIVLTKSMFKCASWLKEYCKDQGIEDPMAAFFEGFHKYQHALYIIRHDANLNNRKIRLSYQVLNTLDLDAVSLDNLIKRHLNEAHAIPKNGTMFAAGAQEADDLEVDDQEADDDVGSLDSSVPVWQVALAKNPDFAKDPWIKDRLEDQEISRILEVGKGQIRVEGTMKFLSGDLFALLIHLIYNRQGEGDGGKGAELGLGVKTEDGQLDLSDGRDARKRLIGSKQLLRTSRFYTADERLHLKSGQRYGILRSPHLSRNEECALQAYVPDEKDTENIYNKYFSHLKHVLMLPYMSLDAIALGGADFDGDMVSLIQNRAINQAILRGAYEITKSGPSNKKAEYVRKLPIVNIPALKAAAVNAPERIPYEVLRNTFDSKVGQISNMAINIGMKEYRSHGEDHAECATYAGKCAECTLANGLEIDAAKTGVHPDITELNKMAGAPSDSYLEFNKKLKNTTILEIKKKGVPQKNKGEYTLGESKSKPPFCKATLYPLGEPYPTLKRLPGYFLMGLHEKSKNKTSQMDACLLFGVPKGSKDVSKETTNAVRRLVQAYIEIGAIGSAITGARKAEETEKNTSIGRIKTLLRELYDAENESLPSAETDLMNAADIALSELQSRFQTADEVSAAIELMKEQEWVFVSEDMREEVLYQILGFRELAPETKSILLCEKPDGFFFLIYYLDAVQKEKEKERPAKERLEREQQDREQSQKSGKEKEEVHSSDAYQLFQPELLSGLEQKEWKKKDWNGRIIKRCREELEKLFAGDFDKALSYCCSCSGQDAKKHQFLWDIFPEEILRNIAKKE